MDFRSTRLGKRGGGARLTRGLDEPGVGGVRDDGDGQIPQVEFQSARDDVDVFVRFHRDVRLLASCEGGGSDGTTSETTGK